jgi:predicted DCC family thiol-disulfide oxidoreductase YuxK
LIVMAHARGSREDTPARDRAVLLYDSDCRFCRFALERVLAWDRHSRLRPLALKDPEAERLLAQLDAQARMDSWHLVERDGEVSSAGEAAAPLLRLLPGGRPLARIAALSPRLTEAAYGLVASNRPTLSRIVGAWWDG